MVKLTSAKRQRHWNQLWLSTALVLTVLGVEPLWVNRVSAHETGPLVAKMQTLRESNQRWIEIDLSSQRLIAWEGQTPVYAIIVSTGKASTPTPTGTFAIQTKHRQARMQGNDYDISDVPYTMYYSGNYAIHGAYWHHKFGTPVSHGCVNVAVDHANWLFDWATVGTPVVVHS
jgi:lipoprotein-anchoring transpeptidase ErfK/SrfK